MTRITIACLAIAALGAFALLPGGVATPERASADKSCGSFRVEGLLTEIKVKITKGDFRCKIARRVMEDLFHDRDTGNWRCIGPQTGYARCKKPNRGTVVARF